MGIQINELLHINKMFTCKKNSKFHKRDTCEYFIWDNILFELEILYLIKANKDRGNKIGEDAFIAKCNPKYYNNYSYISNYPISDLINTKKEAEKRVIISKIENTQKKLAQYTIELAELEKQFKNLE